MPSGSPPSSYSGEHLAYNAPVLIKAYFFSGNRPPPSRRELIREDAQQHKTVLPGHEHNESSGAVTELGGVGSGVACCVDSR